MDLVVENLQDMMLCGGSDSAIIPIGIIQYTCLFFFFFVTIGAIDPFCMDNILQWFDNYIGLGGFVACNSLSQRNSDPKRASRPWDVVWIMNN